MSNAKAQPAPVSILDITSVLFNASDPYFETSFVSLWH